MTTDSKWPIFADPAGTVDRTEYWDARVANTVGVSLFIAVRMSEIEHTINDERGVESINTHPVHDPPKKVA